MKWGLILHINHMIQHPKIAPVFLFFIFVMSKFYQILPPKIAKLVEITLQKQFFSKFSQIFLSKKKEPKFAPKKKEKNIGLHTASNMH